MKLYVTECGAVGDGVTLCTDAINEAITKVNEAGGGYAIASRKIFKWYYFP